MYVYDKIDRDMVRARADEFRDQVARRLLGELSEDQFKPLRLMNGLYLQLHAYMLRVAIPYGVLSAAQMRQFAEIADRYDRGFGHFTTRQNIQFNWIRLIDAPEILDALAEVDMHAIQTSGNCIRNTTTDAFAGAAADETDDPRPWAELIRQWSSLHPEFSYLPRKFKIAITGAAQDRAAIRVHDIGLHLTKDGFDVYVGGGMGRTPHIGPLLRRALKPSDLISYLEATLRVYNRHGRRDNLYKARIKILVAALGIAAFRNEVESEWAQIDKTRINAPEMEIARIKTNFIEPAFRSVAFNPDTFALSVASKPDLARFVRHNLRDHRQADHVSLSISLKAPGQAAGDASSAQMRLMADLADSYAYGELRVSYEQHIVLPHVHRSDVEAVFEALKSADLATANIGQITDMIVCPGLDYCSLANARSIPLSQDIARHFSDPERAERLGKVSLKISGCINACGHHHVGNIGILGVDKQGEEFYQILLGGRADQEARLGQITGKGMPAEKVPAAIDRLLVHYESVRSSEAESFIDTLERLGPKAFIEAVHAE